MAEQAKDGNSSKKIIIVLLIVILILLIGVGAAVFFLLSGNDDSVDDSSGEAQTTEATQNSNIIQYEGGVVDFENIQKEYDEAQKAANANQIAVSYKPSATSTDGKHFTCSLKNPSKNAYDMYFNIYADENFEEQVLITGLVPPGSGIEEFESEIEFEPGNYETVLVMTLVDDDHSTLISQSMVVYRLDVIQE